METIIPRINESGSNIIEDEDDVNTVDSDKTSIYHNGNKNKIILPKMTRYQLMISLDQHNETFNPEETEEIRSPIQRVREILIKMVGQMKTVDPEAEIMSWKCEPNFTFLPQISFQRT